MSDLPSYHAEIYLSGRWKRYSTTGHMLYKRVTDEKGITWNLDYPFVTIEDATAAIKARRRTKPGSGTARGRVVDQTGHVCWIEPHPLTREEKGWQRLSTAESIGPIGLGVLLREELLLLKATQPQEEQVGLNIDGPGDIDQPLHIPRVDLIATLQSNLDAEKAEREKAQQAITTRRFAAQEAVSTLSADELLNLVQKYVTTDLDDIVSFVEEAGKSGRLKSQPQPAGPKETALEKYVRVLGLANDETIEVKPNNPIYPLL